MRPVCFSFFFFNDTATTEIYTLSLHDALPICGLGRRMRRADTAAQQHMHARHQFGEGKGLDQVVVGTALQAAHAVLHRSEEHTSELQSPCNLVCRLLLEKKQMNPYDGESRPRA